MRDEDLARHAFHQVGAYDGPLCSCTTNTGAAFGTATGWTESSRRARSSGSCPRRRPLLTDAPDHKLATGRAARRHSRIGTRDRRSGGPYTEHRTPTATSGVAQSSSMATQCGREGTRRRTRKRSGTFSATNLLPEMSCPECLDGDVVVGGKSADGAKVQRWFECRNCGCRSTLRIVYGAER